VQLALVVCLAAGSLAALLATRPPLTGSAWSGGDDLALVVAWAVALAASAWLFVATGTCVVALGLARPQLARRLAPVLPFGIRSLVEVAIVGSCAVLPALPAPALGPPRVSAVVVDDEPVVRAPETPARETPAPVETAPIPRSAPTPTATPTPSTPPLSTPPLSTPPLSTPPLSTPPLSTPRSRVVVAPGDNLWLIARASLTDALGGRPHDADVARYWHALIAQNRSTLRSGDPSLIFPGEIVTLPPASTVS
jgi:nucleoid-associated protein YgaU